MSLLPKNVTCFKDDSYWNQFFERRGTHAFEWYGEYPELCGILHKYVKLKDVILNVGCGNSTLSENLYDLGYTNNINVDISNTVIKQMKMKHGELRPSLIFEEMDVTNMSFDDEKFSVVIDKGTLDALTADDSTESLKKADNMIREIHRVLKNAGRYICVSLLQKHILNQLLESATKLGLMLRIHRCIEAEQKEYSSKQFSFPVFVVVCTKLKSIPGMKQVLEYVENDTSMPKRFENRLELENIVQSLQQYSFLCHQLNTKKLTEDVTLDLYSNSNQHPRYTVFVVDGKKGDSKYGVFIVPQGRESEWLFSTEDGRQQLRQSAQCQRLLVVHLNRQHTYSSLDEVKSEISERALDFAPIKLESSQVPIMSLGDSIGTRNVIFKGTSDTTGDYFIEDVDLDGDLFRRLIFASNQNVIQSESKMRNTKKKKKGKSSANRVEVDPSYLACQHHSNMIAGFGLLPTELMKGEIKTLVIGLGGGSLPVYIQSYLKNVVLDVVDIDEAIVSIAKEWFNFTPNERLKVHVENGINYIQNAAQNGIKYDVILLDVNNKDISEGLSVPPPAFLEMEFLSCVRNTLSESGILILNLVCRNKQLKTKIYADLLSVFGAFFYVQVPEEVNEIIYLACGNKPSSLGNFKDNLIKINGNIKSQTNSELIDVKGFIEILKSFHD